MNKYVSIFKIDGKPILPPLMTESVKREMQEYKKIACELEYKYEIQRMKNIRAAVERSSSSLSSDDSSSVELPTTYRKTESSFPDLMHNDSALDTSIASTIEECIETDIPEIKPIGSGRQSACENDGPKNLAEKVSICGHGISDHLHSEMSKSMPPPVTRELDPSPGALIRSNSYTLLTPSPMLLKQMELDGVEVEERKKLEPKKLYSEKTFTYKTAPKKSKPRVGPKNPIISVHHKKSPYDTSVTPKNRTQITKTSVVKLTTKLPANAKEHIRNVSSEPITKSARNDLKMLSQLKDAQKKQLIELLARQKDEEKKLEEEFHKKHDLILKQLQESIMTTHNVAKHNEAVIEPVSQVLLQQYLDMAKQPTPPPKSNNTTHSSKSAQDTTLEAGATCVQQKHSRGNSMPQKPPRATRSENDKRDTAATIINAYVRGYLVRRLFKTDHAQKIVQVIRDTLIFVLDLYEESLINNNPGDTVLKSRLLQQLTSACESLHELFFNTTHKQRMDIIARDRDLMKTRIKRLQTLANNNKYDLKISKKNNKIELYSIN